MTQNVPSRSQSKTLAGKAGFAIHAVLTISQLLEYWEVNGNMEKGKMEETKKFLVGRK